MRFQPGMKVQGWHFDGRTSSWTTGTAHTILATEGASTLFAGVVAGFAGLLAF